MVNVDPVESVVKGPKVCVVLSGLTIWIVSPVQPNDADGAACEIPVLSNVTSPTPIGLGIASTRA